MAVVFVLTAQEFTYTKVLDTRTNFQLIQSISLVTVRIRVPRSSTPPLVDVSLSELPLANKMTSGDFNSLDFIAFQADESRHKVFAFRQILSGVYGSISVL